MKIPTVVRKAPQSKRKTKKKSRTSQYSRTPQKQKTQVNRKIPSKPSKLSDKFGNKLRHNTMELYLRKFEVEVLPIFLKRIKLILFSI